MLDVIIYEGSERIILGIVVGFILTLITGLILVYLSKRKDYSFLQNIRDDELWVEENTTVS